MKSTLVVPLILLVAATAYGRWGSCPPSELALWNDQPASSVTLSQGLAYVVVSAENVSSWNGVIVVLDISDPRSPHQVGTFAIPDWRPACCVVSDQLAYVTGHVSSYSNGGIWVFDVTDPAEAELIGSCGLPGSQTLLAVSQGVAITAALNSGLHLVDVSDPGHPTIVGEVDSVAIATALEMTGPLALVGREDDGRLLILDVTIPSAPVEVGSYLPPAGWGCLPQVLDLAVRPPHVFVATSCAGVVVLDISDPTRPSDVASLAGVGASNHLSLSGTYLAATDTSVSYPPSWSESNVLLWRVTNPLFPSLIGRLRVAEDLVFQWTVYPHPLVSDGALVLEIDEEGLRVLSFGACLPPRPEEELLRSER